MLAFRFTIGRSEIGDLSDASGPAAARAPSQRVARETEVLPPSPDARLHCRRIDIAFRPGRGDARLVARRLEPLLASSLHPVRITVSPWPPGVDPDEPAPDARLFLHQVDRSETPSPEGTRVETRWRALLGSGMAQPAATELLPSAGFAVDFRMEVDVETSIFFPGWSRENARRIAVANHAAALLGEEVVKQWTEWRDRHGLAATPDSGWVPPYREPPVTETLKAFGFSPLAAGPGWLTPHQSVWVGHAPVDRDPLPDWRKQLGTAGWSSGPIPPHAGEEIPLRLTSGTRTLWLWPARPDHPFDAVAAFDPAADPAAEGPWCAVLIDRPAGGELGPLIQDALQRPPIPWASLAMVRAHWGAQDLEQAAERLRRLPPSSAEEAWLAARVHRDAGDPRAAEIALRAARLLRDLGPTPGVVAEAIDEAWARRGTSAEAAEAAGVELPRALGFIDLGAVLLHPETRSVGYRDPILVFREEPGALRIGSVWLEPPPVDAPASVRAVTTDIDPSVGRITSTHLIGLPPAGETRRLTGFPWADGVRIEFERQPGRTPFVVYLHAAADEG